MAQPIETSELMSLIGNMIDTLEKQDKRISDLEQAVVSSGELIQNHNDGIMIIMNALQELGIE